jgi:hypothetical protein
MSYSLFNCKFLVVIFVSLFGLMPSAFAANFVLISSHPRATYVEIHSQKSIENDSPTLPTNGKKFSFYPSGDSLIPQIIEKLHNAIYLVSKHKKLHFMGSFLAAESAQLVQFKNCVAQGRVLFGIRTKANQLVAFIADKSGCIYSVTQQSKQDYSIEPLGILANNS